MSLINQVLNDLDKRGASTKIGEATIRVVPLRNQRHAFWLVAAGVAGTLLVGAAAWLWWDIPQRSPASPVVVAAPLQPAPVLPASQPVAVHVPVVPKIDSVSPSPVLATGTAQTITIMGSNFREGASVTLRKEGGAVYANRPIDTLAPEQIVLKVKLGRKPTTWMVEVLNADGTSSGPFAIAVQAPLVAALSAEKQLATATPGAVSNKAETAVARPGTVRAGGINKQPTQISLQQQSDNEFRRAYQLMRQGRDTDALAGYENALKLDPGHEQARQTMVSLLLEKKRSADAERVLQEGLQGNAQQANFAMLLARLQVERNAVPVALETLQRTLPYAGSQPDYLAFVAALLQRQSRHKEAIDYYQKALQFKPQSGVWMMGMAISLRAEQRNAEAREVFQQALNSNSLNGELQAFVRQQLKEL